MKTLTTATLTALLIVGLATSSPAAQGEPGWTWVPGHTGPRGEAIDGFYRHAEREGYRWVAPYVTEAGAPVPGHWRPNAPEGEGWIFVAGWVEPDGTYNPGFWRRAAREGYTWAAGRLDGGQWLLGHWMPTTHRAGLIWVPGHVGPEGRWVMGFWRQAARQGFLWVDGYWCEGAWYHPHWMPLSPRLGFVWVVGHVIDGMWSVGFWRPETRAGYIWVPAHWRYGAWTAGFWHVGVWAPGPGMSPIHHAEAGGDSGTLVRDAHKKVLQPRYVAYLIQRRVESPAGEGRGKPRREAREEREERDGASSRRRGGSERRGERWDAQPAHGAQEAQRREAAQRSSSRAEKEEQDEEGSRRRPTMRVPRMSTPNRARMKRRVPARGARKR